MLLESCEHHFDEYLEFLESSRLIRDFFYILGLEITPPKVASCFFLGVEYKPQVAWVKRSDLYRVQRENVFNLKEQILVKNL